MVDSLYDPSLDCQKRAFFIWKQTLRDLKKLSDDQIELLQWAFREGYKAGLRSNNKQEKPTN